MEDALFIYNLILTAFFIIALTGFYILYMKSRKRVFLFLFILYIVMVIDNSIIYISEFSYSFESLYETSFLLYIVVDLIYLGIILTFRFIIAELFSDKLTVIEKLIFIASPIGLMILNLFAPTQVGDIIIYVPFFAALAYLSVRIYKDIKNTDTFNKATSKKYMAFLFISIILSMIGLVETTVYLKSLNSILPEYRILSFDVIKLLICIVGVRYLYTSFENLFNKIPDDKNVDAKLIVFCAKYSLTGRQREIIKLIIDGYSNKEISNKLNITEGTVKTHVHNIFQKTEITSRNQILKKIMEY